MGVCLRLLRTGTTKKVSYRLVATDRRSPRDGHYLEILGSYNPRTEPVFLQLKAERIQYWLGKGALASEAVRDLLKSAKIAKPCAAIS